MPLELPLGPSPSSAVAPPKTIKRCPPPSAGTHVKVCPQRGPGSSLLGSMWNSAHRNPVVEDDILAALRPTRRRERVFSPSLRDARGSKRVCELDLAANSRGSGRFCRQPTRPFEC